MMEAREPLADTYEQMLRERLPNLFRLYLNPYLAQTCLCLERYIQETWQPKADKPERYQSFLANSFDEALSGAIKLARYCAAVAGRSTSGLVIDPNDRLGPFASDGGVVFLPGLTVVRGKDPAPEQPRGFVVLVGPDALADESTELLCQGALTIVCVDRQALLAMRGQTPWDGSPEPSGRPRRAVSRGLPDIVVFDESFVHRDVPFAAFCARQPLYDHWNRPNRSTFHSTTFQPNIVSTLHFMRCLERDDAEFHGRIAGELRSIAADPDKCLRLLRRLYSPALARAIAATGFATPNVWTEGSFVAVQGRRVLDGVSGVACSVRGHNPPAYAREIEALAGVDCEAEVTTRLHDLTGLPHQLPAVSGAGAVENALKIALTAQFPRRHVIALRSGFGGKTLVALTGTWNASYKEHIGPLHEDVSYVDPFAPDASARIDALLEKHSVALVQMELVQGVGGVRRVPEQVVRHLDAQRARHGYLLLVDEVQTGVHRTGPFTLSKDMGLTPDLLVIGKAVSDMMFPFALTLYADTVRHKLDQVGSSLSEALRRRYAYPLGYKTALNVLRLAQETRLAERVAKSGALFAKLLGEELGGCKVVREVRTYGLLIGIELEDTGWPQRWFKKRLFWFYLAAMLRHARFPVLVGFCQYEPNVLKITPPLTIAPEDVRQMCAVIGEVLRRPFYKLLTSAVGGMLRSFHPWRKNHDAPVEPAREHALR